MPEPIFRKHLSFTTSLSTTVLSLSLLAGCASSPEQPLSTEAPNTQPIVQTEETVKAETTAVSETKTESEEVIKSEVDASTAAEESITSEQKEVSITKNTQTPEPSAAAKAAPPVVATSSSLPSKTTKNPISQTTQATAIARSENNLGNSYGIWTLKKSDDGLCKLSTPTLQTSTSNNEYSSQIWMDIEEQRIVVNAFMSMDIAHPKTGIQIDNQTLIPFTEKLYSTRAVVTGNLTTELAQGNQLHIFINGKEVGKQVLKRDVSLTNMNSAINALQSCGK